MNLNLSAFQSQEFIVGIAVAAILVSALIASSMFRNIALALAAGGVVLLYLQGGVPALLATSAMVEKEIRALPGVLQRAHRRICGRGGVSVRHAETSGLTSDVRHRARRARARSPTPPGCPGVTG